MSIPPQNIAYFRTLFDAIPSPVIIVDGDVRIEDANAAGLRMLGSKDSVYRKRGGDTMHCIQSTRSPGGCGHAADCADCIIRSSVRTALAGQAVTRRRMRMELHAGTGVAELYLLVTASPFAYEGRSLVLLLLEDINELVALKSLLPVCSWCKKVRGDDQYWQSVEEYLRKHTDIDVSHSICEECLEKQLREMDARLPPPFSQPVRK